MKKIGIIYNFQKERAREEMVLIKNWLLKKNFKVTVLPSSSKRLPPVDLAVSLGGDGTMLKASALLANAQIPVLGINMGSLGFLAETNPEESYDFLEKILKGKFEIEKRMMLEVKIYSNSKITKNYALNECMIHSGNNGRVITVSAAINKEFLADFIGDGLIISTPTGSTAYSLAASGPIVYPNLSVFVITPICPHTLAQRPMIVPTKDVTIELKVSSKNIKERPSVVIDGQTDYFLEKGNFVNVSVSAKPLLLIINPNRKYLQVLRAKLKWGERG
ncbi:MAG: NAD(+)/NADH kinase [Elusimicrobia bacterium]|nr:NAD(+)/NADH kinase [Elusimicrobiota bacterium]